MRLYMIEFSGRLKRVVVPVQALAPPSEVSSIAYKQDRISNPVHTY